MSIMSREITGSELANALALKLSDLEFELLVRVRIRMALQAAHQRDSNLSESHNLVTFTFDGRDSSTWSVTLGRTYSNYKNATGEVLSATFYDAETMLELHARNKMSLLLSCTTSASQDGATLSVNAGDDAPL